MIWDMGGSGEPSRPRPRAGHARYDPTKIESGGGRGSGGGKMNMCPSIARPLQTTQTQKTQHTCIHAHRHGKRLSGATSDSELESLGVDGLPQNLRTNLERSSTVSAGSEEGEGTVGVSAPLSLERLLCRVPCARPSSDRVRTREHEKCLISGLCRPPWQTGGGVVFYHKRPLSGGSRCEVRVLLQQFHSKVVHK